MPKYTILFLSANPMDTEPCLLQQEMREIREGLERANGRENFTLECRTAVRPQDVRRAMLDLNPNIVHFSGYGSKQQGLVFQDESGNAKAISEQAIAKLFQLFDDKLTCVLLNACYTESQARVISKYINYAIGMNEGVDSKSAIDFSVGFYDALGAGKDFKFAYRIGCNAINLAGNSGNCKPILLQKSSTDIVSTVTASISMPELYSTPISINELPPCSAPGKHISICNNFVNFLDEMDIEIIHRNCEKVILQDLFVYPNLQYICDSLDEITNEIPSKNILEKWNKIIISGDERAGKTSLAKKLFRDALDYGSIPIFFNANDIKSSNINETINNIASEIFNEFKNNKYLEVNEKKICIIDDFSSLRLNRKAQSRLLNNLDDIFDQIILVVEEAFSFVKPSYPELDEYKEFTIQTFNNVNRGELIRKWVDLETTEETNEQEIYSRIDELRINVESLIRKNVVPAKPFYILMLLQSFEMTKANSIELSSYGHCYQYLIYQSFERERIKQNEIDSYLNVLSEFGGELFDISKEILDTNELEEFFNKYTNKFLPVQQDRVIDDLIRCSILQKTELGVKFKYRYLFYFFAAKKLSDSLHKGKVAQTKIRDLVDSIHLEKSSNIILFLVHHSKDPWILDEILLSIMELFSKEKEVTLESNSLLFLEAYIKDIPELILELKNVDEERLKKDERLDEIEKNKNFYSNEEEDYNFGNREFNELLANVNKVFRSTEVCGQILRNRTGSLEREALELIYEESVSVSLRFLEALLKYTAFAQEESSRRIQNILLDKPDIPTEKIIKDVENFYLALNYFMILGMLNRTSYALGSSKGRQIYDKVTSKKNTPAYQLVQFIIELQFEKKLDFDKIDEIQKYFTKNPVCSRLFKHIILNYCYMHELDYKEKQKLASKLGISMQTQRKLSIASRCT